MTAALSIVSARPSGSEARVIGPVGAENADWLTGHLRELEGDITLDCSRLQLEDIWGARALVEFGRTLERHGRRLVLRAVPPPVRRAIERIVSG
jgi:anti-anti-sigma regulatory factor